MAPRPAGCPILTRKVRRRAAGGSGSVPGSLYRERDALPRGPPARPRRGPARPPRRRPLPLARGRRRPAHRGVDASAGRPGRRGPGRAAAAAAVRRPARAAGARRRRRRPGLARAAGPSRPAATPARSTPSCGSARPTAPCACWSTRWRSTRRGRRRSTPGPPSWEGDRLAYQLSTGGDEESRLYVLDVATGEIVDGPIDRCRYSPVAWLPGGEELFYVRRLAPGPGARRRGAVPPPGVAPPGRRRPADDRRPGPRRGQRPDHLLRRAHQPRRPLAGRLRLGRHRAARRRVDRRPAAADGDALREFQVGVDAQTAAWVARDGRLWLITDRDTPRWRLAVADPADPATWAPGGLAGRRPGAARRRALRRRARRRGRRRSRCSPCTPSTPPTGCRSGPRTGPGSCTDVEGLGAGSISGVSAPPEGGSAAWVGYTDYATPPSVLRWDAGDADAPWRAGSRRPSPATCRR